MTMNANLLKDTTFNLSNLNPFIETDCEKMLKLSDKKNVCLNE